MQFEGTDQHSANLRLPFENRKFSWDASNSVHRQPRL